MNFNKTNNITGWIVCLIACSVYILTMERTGSFWDVGEFVSSCYKLQIPHPPGAPLFVLIGRLFTLPFSNAAVGVNLMSAIASGFTILFLFWTITHFARKIVVQANDSVKIVGNNPAEADDSQDRLSGNQLFSVMAAGVIGALAYTFSDSFWYSAVEGEVYALSSFFTAIVFWAICKWEREVTEEQRSGNKARFTRADRWLILIFYLMGLSVGVHLLNLLTIPALVMVYYFKRYNVTRWGAFWAFVIGCVITGVIQKAVIQWSIQLAGQFDIFFVNSLNLPFFVGFGFFFVLLAIAIYFVLRWANKRNYNFLKLGMWIVSFMLLGYSTYVTTLIRSNADPAIDMFNVDNPVNLVGYLSREQYGDWPILYGQDFTAEPSEQKAIDTYVKGQDKYEKNGRKYETKYAAADKHFFPRMWDASNEQGHADYYAAWAGIGKNQDGSYERAPTMGENIGFFLSYQLNWMYLRYFMWNFAGKQNDIQGINMSNIRDGNWKTGIGFLDNWRLGNQEMMPDSAKNNKANNSLYGLPLILGILGFIYLYNRNRRDALVTFLLFFFTGFAIVIYLNQAGNQPRERDYAYVGSFYAYAIWIGLGVLFVRDLLNRFIKNIATSNYVAAAVCFAAVPLLMAFQEWDDHDRSRKVLARDLAIDYLESCAPNAIVISFGDNDTYPLWYAQEVEGIRPDVRVINSSLLGTDWYVNQLRYKINKSDPIDVIWTPEQIQGSKRDVIYHIPNMPGTAVDQTRPMDLYTMMKDIAGSDDQSKMFAHPSTGEYFNTYPTKLVKVPVNLDVVRQNGTVNVTDSVVSELVFDLKKPGLVKNETAILNIIAANQWKRPIYFTSPYDELGFAKYLRSDGLTYRLVPVENGNVNQNWALDKMMNKFVFGNAHLAGVYFDEENRRHLNTIRMQYALTAIDLVQSNRKEEAKKLLNKADKMMIEQNFPYGMVSRRQQHNQIAAQFLYASLLAGDSALAKKVSASVTKDLNQQMAYYGALSEDQQMGMYQEIEAANQLLQQITQMEQSLQQNRTNPERGPAIQNAPPTGAGDSNPKDNG
jgi:hypothetical protein